jgi:cobaltochelatase CobS
MEKYHIQQYENLINEEDRKRYDLVKKLSQNFTVENATARSMDNLLSERYKDLQHSLPESKPREQEKDSSKKKETKESRSEKPEKPKPSQGAMQTAEDLFRSILEHQQNSGSDVSEKQLQNSIEQAFKSFKIEERNLSNELAQKLAIKPQIIKYELPNISLPEFEKPPIGSFQSIVDDVLMGNNVFLVGGAGTGKTYLAEQLLSRLALKREYVTINCSQWTSPTEIIGGQTMDGYVEGKLIEAWSKGMVLILDELPKIDPNTAGLFNDALAKTKLKDAVIFNSRKEKFVKHENFACIATGNIYPDKESIAYGANNKQDLSLLDRFSGSVYFIEKNPEIERKVVGNDMIWSLCDALRAAVEELKYEAQLSLRFMQNARDSYLLEMSRVKQGGTLSNEGKSLKTAIDSYLSVFTPIQQGNLKAKINYTGIIASYQYRNLPTNQNILGRR